MALYRYPACGTLSVKEEDMPTIFEYQDYRKFLADFYKEKKSTHPTFSYQNFSLRAGFTSKSFLFNVIKGKKTLSRTSVVRLCDAMALKKSEAAYFENLVYFNQATGFNERTFYFDKLNALHPATATASRARNLRQDQFEFFSQWYNVVIRSLIDLYPSIRDPQELARRVYPPITPRQAQKAVDLLLRHGLLAKNPDGTCSVSEKVITTGPEVRSLALQQFHLSCMELAAAALRKLPRKQRDISGLTLGISMDSYAKIRSEIYAFQEKILAIAEQDELADHVFQLNFQLFPVSRTIKEKKPRKPRQNAAIRRPHPQPSSAVKKNQEES